MNFFQRHKKLMITLGIVGVAVAGGGMKLSSMQKEAAAQLAVLNQPEIAQVEKRSLIESVAATGTVTSVNHQTSVAPVNGVKVKKVNVKVGDMVKRGDILVVLDSTDLQDDLADAKKSLGVTKDKNKIDANAAERSLSEAKVSRNIELERADEDVANAWNSYADAVDALSEAENDYDAAWMEAEEARVAFEDSQAQLDALTVSRYDGVASSEYEDGFREVKEELKRFIYALSDPSYQVERKITLRTDFEALQKEELIGSSKDADMARLARILEDLARYQKDYQEAAEAEAAVAAEAAQLQQMQEETAALESAYNTKAAEVEQKEAAIKSAEAAVDSSLDAYRQRVRGQNDTARNGNSDVQSKKDAVRLSEIGNETSAQTEEKSIRSLEKQIEDCTIVAELSGVVTSVKVKEDDLYAGGEIVTVEDESDYEIATEIDEYDISKIQVGQTAVIKTNATGDRELTGRVREIAPRATKSEGVSQGGVTYQVIISVDSGKEGLKMDMPAKLSIILEQKTDALSVPYRAVQEDEKGFYVEKAGSEAQTDSSGETSEKIYITKGLETDYYVEIIGENVTEGMNILVPKIEGEGDTLESLLADDSMEGF